MERVEQLEQEHRDLMVGFRFQHAQGNGRALEDDQRAFFAKLRKGLVPPPKREDEQALLGELLTLGSMLKKPVS